MNLNPSTAAPIKSTKLKTLYHDVLKKVAITLGNDVQHQAKEVDELDEIHVTFKTHSDSVRYSTLKTLVELCNRHLVIEKIEIGQMVSAMTVPPILIHCKIVNENLLTPLQISPDQKLMKCIRHDLSKAENQIPDALFDVMVETGTILCTSMKNSLALEVGEVSTTKGILVVVGIDECEFNLFEQIANHSKKVSDVVFGFNSIQFDEFESRSYVEIRYVSTSNKRKR